VNKLLPGALAVVFALAGTRPAAAWPSSILEQLARDARRLLPRSLSMLMHKHEKEIIEEAQRFPPELQQLMATDLAGGKLQPETLAALQLHAQGAVDLLKRRQVSAGVVKLGALLRIPADLADPVLTAGEPGYPAGVTREYYSFVQQSLPKIPVVLDDKAALRLRRDGLSPYWLRLYDRSRSDGPVIRIEMFRNGRVVDHRTLDYRSPVFGVASLAYSRAVTSIAATWLVLWRSVGGDATLMPVPSERRAVEPAAPVVPASPAASTPPRPR
jgi:hypothetical protein